MREVRVGDIVFSRSIYLKVVGEVKHVDYVDHVYYDYLEIFVLSSSNYNYVEPGDYISVFYEDFYKDFTIINQEMARKLYGQD